MHESEYQGSSHFFYQVKTTSSVREPKDPMGYSGSLLNSKAD